MFTPHYFPDTTYFAFLSTNATISIFPWKLRATKHRGITGHLVLKSILGSTKIFHFYLGCFLVFDYFQRLCEIDD